MFDPEIATINMCDIHITTILLTVTMYILHVLIYMFDPKIATIINILICSREK